jgi:hypothetical protein
MIGAGSFALLRFGIDSATFLHEVPNPNENPCSVLTPVEQVLWNKPQLRPAVQRYAEEHEHACTLVALL